MISALRFTPMNFHRVVQFRKHSSVVHGREPYNNRRIIPLDKNTMLRLLIVLLLPVSLQAQTLADRLAGVKAELFAEAPGYSEGPTWRDGELFFCSGALLRVDKDRKVTKHLDINPAGT